MSACDFMLRYTRPLLRAVIIATPVVAGCLVAPFRSRYQATRAYPSSFEDVYPFFPVLIFTLTGVSSWSIDPPQSWVTLLKFIHTIDANAAHHEKVTAVMTTYRHSRRWPAMADVL